MKALVGKDRKKIADAFKHIADLKPGDKVAWKDAIHVHNKVPALGETVEVFTVNEPRPSNADSGSPYVTDINDFTIAYIHPDGKLIVHAYDSRYFVRVE